MLFPVIFRSLKTCSSKVVSFSEVPAPKQWTSVFMSNSVLPSGTKTVAVTPCRLYSAKVDPKIPVVDYEYVTKATSDDNILIIDVREPEEVREHGKIPNSINIPLSDVQTVLSTVSEEEFFKTYYKPKPRKDTEIIFYCKVGRRSGWAHQDATEVGFINTKNYLGSWREWSKK